ncbi:MAG: hypothetical protein ACSHW7_12185 [Patiriisocius sp.]|uniref:hypothetical protein n=1 Tax=Patiriisocius sp. TaxID=2822396 RepID=UPI003EF0F977
MKKEETKLFQKNLKKGHQLLVSETSLEDEIKVLNANGTPLFSMKFSENGTTVKISAENISFNAEKSIKLSAKDIEIESLNDIKMVSQGDLKTFTKGDTIALTEGEKIDTAKIQTIKAELGNVDIVANDDVTLKGERVKLN